MGIELRSAISPAVAIVLLVMGCDIPKRPPITSPAKNKQVQEDLPSARNVEIVEPPQAAFSQDWEAWDAYFLKGKQVGYSHVKAEALLSEAIRGSDATVQYILEDQIRFRRGNGTFVQHLKQTSTETSVGVLLDFEATMHIGPIVKHYRGVVEDDKLKVETVQGSKSSIRTIDWQSTYRGLIAVQQSLRRKPMIQGERRKIKALSPIQYELNTVELFCVGEAAVPTIDGSYQKLIEIATQYVVGQDLVVNQTVWVNEDGDIRKTLRLLDGLTSYRTDKDTALAGAIPGNELLKATKIDVSGDFDQPREATRVAFLIRPNREVKQQGQPVQIENQPNQYVRELDDGTIQIFVSRRDAGPPQGFQTLDLQPTDGDRQANRLIDFQAKLIGQLATAAGKSTRGEKQLAIDLAATVRDLMTPTETSRGLLKASEIANTPEGGCLEHAIFLAAMLRARGIPARLALGFVYTPGEHPTMAFHVWDLAYADGQWIPLDPVLGSLAPPDRITLATTDLAGGDEYSVFQPIMSSLGQFDVEIRGAD